LIQLISLPNVSINHLERVTQAITWHKQGLDFADAFHLANSQSCKKLLFVILRHPEFSRVFYDNDYI
jgi:hypothetical protein